jgi:hypothetical protein
LKANLSIVGFLGVPKGCDSATRKITQKRFPDVSEIMISPRLKSPITRFAFVSGFLFCPAAAIQPPLKSLKIRYPFLLFLNFCFAQRPAMETKNATLRKQ